MLLTGWTKEIFRAACRPEAQTVHCIARLEQNIGAVIPYLNAVLDGHTYVKEPPSVTFRNQGAGGIILQQRKRDHDSDNHPGRVPADEGDSA